MKLSKQKKLEASGWQVGSVKDFLSLPPEEATYLELILLLSKELKRRRNS